MDALMGRLRAAFTPRVLLTLAAVLLLMGFLPGIVGSERGTQLERRASDVLSHVSGAGRVSVVIRTKAQEEGASAIRMSAAKVEAIPCGAVAVAQGADDPLVRLELEQALCALLGLPASAVEIVAGGGD